MPFRLVELGPSISPILPVRKGILASRPTHPTINIGGSRLRHACGVTRQILCAGPCRLTGGSASYPEHEVQRGHDDDRDEDRHRVHERGRADVSTSDVKPGTIAAIGANRTRTTTTLTSRANGRKNHTSVAIVMENK